MLNILSSMNARECHVSEEDRSLGAELWARPAHLRSGQGTWRGALWAAVAHARLHSQLLLLGRPLWQ